MGSLIIAKPNIILLIGLLLLGIGGLNGALQAHQGHEHATQEEAANHVTYVQSLERARAMQKSRVADLANLKELGPDRQAQAIRYCDGLYFITHESGRVSVHWEFNVRIKTDSSKRGPNLGKPVLVPRGSTGDRWFLIFAGPREINQLIQMQC